MASPQVDLSRALVTADDLGLKQMLGRVVSKTVEMNMYNTETNANWIGDRICRRESFPLMVGSAPFQYSTFKLELGDLFKLSIPLYGISDMVCRVMGRSVGNIENDTIQIEFQQDPDYITAESIIPLSIRSPASLDFTLSILTDITIMEAPYSLSGESIQLVPLVGRQKGTELGYKFYVSYDGGSSYNFLQYVPTYVAHGVLVNNVEITGTLDNSDVGIVVDMDLEAEGEALQTITRTQMIAGGNVSVMTDGSDSYGEIFCFETVTPDGVVADRYKLTGLFRGRYDTMIRSWTAGDDFYFIGNGYELVENPNFVKGASYHFKLVPYNYDAVGEISDAIETSYTFIGRSYAPYHVSNLRANDEGIAPTYLGWTGITLDWTTSVRGEGAGLYDADNVTDASPTYEGLFEVKVYVSDTLKRTATAINDTEWEYTKAMSKTDNGTPPDEVMFEVVNYKTTDGVRYDSQAMTSRVTRVGMSSTTTSSTTTTTTV